MTEHWFGPVHLALAHVETKNGFEQWAIVSDEPTDLHTLDEFGLRFDIEADHLCRKVDAHWQRGVSYLQIGWRWLSHALANGKELPSHLCLLLQADFEMVFTSKRQAARPIAALYSLSLLRRNPPAIKL